MTCPDNIAVGYGDNTDESPLGYRENVGGTITWYPMLCTEIVSGSGSSAVINGVIYPIAGGSQTRTNVNYSAQPNAAPKWFCTELTDPGGIVRG